MDLSADAVGGWLQLPGSATAEVMGSVGFDFVCVDTQHGLIGEDALLPMLQALDATGTPTLVRVPRNDPDAIGRALDRAAGGVVVSLVDTAGQAAAAVAACRYPPDGVRSYGPTRGTWRERPEPVCVVMVETAAAVAALEDILAVPGVDAVFVGPSDLSLGTGTAQDGDPAFDALLSRIVGAVRAAGLPVGIYCASAAHVERFRALGFTFVAGPSDAALLRSAAAGHLRRSAPGAGAAVQDGAARMGA